ncbi:MAG TPA: hypothetical protein VMU43_06200 [Candidatus Acidoferrum sp.]|nr:hypothetical protein [Candidatus Acidoferrum sp.]
MVQLLNRKTVKGYLNPVELGATSVLNLLTTDGEHKEIALGEVKCVYFVKEFRDAFEPERKAFLSRPKLDGLWVRLKFKDEDEIEGIVANDLLELLDSGVQLTPPDLHGNSLRLFIPRTALSELRVLGVVGAAKHTPRATKAPMTGQAELFHE